MATNEDVLNELLAEARKRQRKKTDLLDFEPQIKEMMRLNISLPIILGWLEKEDKKTTLPALRRYVKKAFGEDHYEDFTRRNGWMKVKAEKEEQKPHEPKASAAPDSLDGGEPGASTVPPATDPPATAQDFANKAKAERAALLLSPESKSQNKTPPAIALRCLALKDGIEPLKKRENIPPEVYLPGDLEHPKIPGLMLSLEDRLYSAALEYANENGEVKLETLDEKRFRILWRHPIAMTPTMTGDSFTKMDENSYKKQ